MSWFSRRPKPIDVLSKLMEIEVRRAELRGNIELRRLELEAEHIEERSKADLADKEWRAKRREAMRKLNATLPRDPRTKRLQGLRVAAESGCPLCDNPLRRDVSVQMVLKHREHESDGAPAGEPPPIEPRPDEAPKAPTDLN